MNNTSPALELREMPTESRAALERRPVVLCSLLPSSSARMRARLVLPQSRRPESSK